MIPREKLGAACFAENVKLFADFEKDPERYNLYRGLVAMSEVLEQVLQRQDEIERQIAQLKQKSG